MSMIGEQIQELRRLQQTIANSTLPNDECVRQNKVIGSAIETIQELSEKLHTVQMERSIQYYNGGWIPCSERMPTESPSIFAKFKNTPVWDKSMWEKGSNTVIVTKKFESGERIISTAKTHDGEWIFDVIDARCEITAWMPLPEPYEED